MRTGVDQAMIVVRPALAMMADATLKMTTQLRTDGPAGNMRRKISAQATTKPIAVLRQATSTMAAINT